WLSILEACYILYKLPPYFENFSKRVVKSPKIYFCDVGLVSYLLGIENIEQIARDPLRGHLFENLVVNELMKARYNQGLEPRFYFFQEAGRIEVDVIYPKGHQLVPIEIKSTKTFNSSLLQGLLKFKNIATDRCTDGYLIYAGADEMRIGSNQLINYQNTAQVIVNV
ncbi:MAG: DUF4143 domain-containing protein, partial [Verrucomicrobia bacterium]|nr:DUF4143 domain-containing protein [Verrucomicrobiota bacterium]